MRFDIELDEYKNKVMTLTYNEDKIVFDIEPYLRYYGKKFSSDAMSSLSVGLLPEDRNKDLRILLEPLNNYILKMVDEKRFKLFSLYKNFLSLITQDVKFEDELEIMKLFNALIHELNFNNFKNHMNWKENIVTPHSVKNEVEYDEDLTRTENKTYVTHDYKNLIYLIIFMRFLLPMIGELYGRYERKVKLVNFKIWSLLSPTPLYTSKETEKLRIYIGEQKNTSSNSSKSSDDPIILDLGLAEEDIVEAIVADTLLGDNLLRDYYRDNTNIVSSVYNTIANRTNSLQDKPDNLTPKKFKEDPSKEDMSYFEDFRKAVDIPVGNIVEVEFFLSDTRRLIQVLGMTNYYDENVFREEHKRFQQAFVNKPNNVQFKLLGWFINPYINHRAVYYLTRSEVIELFSLMHHLLYNKGDVFISHLIASNTEIDEVYHTSFVRNIFTQQDREMLAMSHNYFTNHDILEKKVIEMTKEICDYRWIPIFPDKLREGDGHRLRLNIPQQLNSILVKFLTERSL